MQYQKKSYREASTFHWQEFFAHRIADYAKAPEAEVRHITMPNLSGIKNIDGACSELIQVTYSLVRNALRMQYSDELGLYIVDV